VTASLDQVRGQVVREWESDRRQRARNDAYAKMRSRYEISIASTLEAERP
jgi:hypothetical protein